MSAAKIPDYKDLLARCAAVGGRSREIALALTERLAREGTADFTLPEQNLDNLLWADPDKKFWDFFSEYSDEGQALAALIGPAEAKVAKDLWDDCPSYPCPYYGRWRPGSPFFAKWHSLAPPMDGMEHFIRRPPYRPAKNFSHYYYRPALALLLAFCVASLKGFSLEKYLKEPSPAPKVWPYVDENDFIARLITLKLKSEVDLLSELAPLMTPPGQKCDLKTCQIISALMKCGRPEALALVTARLDQAQIKISGRRRATKLDDDFGHQAAALATLSDKKAFLGLTDIILNKNLLRAPLVAKAAISWLGLDDGCYIWADLDDGMHLGLDLNLKDLGLGETGWLEKVLAQARRSLTDEDYRQKLLVQGRPLPTMLALWAAAFSDLEKALGEARQLLNQPNPESRLGAIGFAVSCGHPPTRFNLLRPLLDDPEVTQDLEQTAWLLQGLPEDLFEMCCRHQAGQPYDNIFKVGAQGPPSGHIYLTPQDAAGYYQALKTLFYQILERRSQCEQSAHSRLLPKMTVGYSPANLTQLMMQPLFRPMALSNPKARPAFDYFKRRCLSAAQPVEQFKARWKLTKIKIINPNVLTAKPDLLDDFFVPGEDGSLPIRDDLLNLFSQMTSPARDLLFANLAGPRPSPRARKTLAEAMVHGGARFDDVQSLFLLTEYSAKELVGLEDLLTTKGDLARKTIYIKLLMAYEDRPEEVAALIKRLQDDSAPRKRQAAGDLLGIIRRRQDPTWDKLAAQITKAENKIERQPI